MPEEQRNERVLYVLMLDQFKADIKMGGLRYAFGEKWFWALGKVEQSVSEDYRQLVVQLTWLPFFTIIIQSGSSWKLKQLISGNEYYFPDLEHHYRFSRSEQKKLLNKYNVGDELSIEEDDIVIEVGPFVGTFTIAARNHGAKIIALEPSPESAACLKQTFQYDNQVIVHNVAAYKENTEIELQFGKDRSEDGVFTPDDGGIGDSVTVQAKTIETVMQEHDIDQLDFLKIEAEGAEPEVLEGTEGISIQKVTINATGERTISEKNEGEICAGMLDQFGYNVKSKEYSVCGLYPDHDD